VAWLTKQERWTLAVLIVLLITGGVTKFFRGKQPVPPPASAEKQPAKP
jgi:hypothetical protein